MTVWASFAGELRSPERINILVMESMTRRCIFLVIVVLLLPLGPSRAIARQTKELKQRADSLYAKGQWEKAERRYRDLAEQSRGEERAYAEYKAGVCLAKQGRYSEAVGTGYKLFVFDKESEWSARAMEDAAEISITQFREKGKGIWLYEWAVERFPDRPGSGSILHKVAMLHFNEGDFTQALATFERVLREYPKSKLVGSAREYATRCRKGVEQPARVVPTEKQERPPGMAAENLPIPSYLEGLIIVGKTGGGGKTEFIKEEDCPFNARRDTIHCKTMGSLSSRCKSCPWIYPVEDEQPRHFTDTDENIWIPIWGTWRVKLHNGIMYYDENKHRIGGITSAVMPHSWTKVDYCVVVPDHFSR